MARDKYDDDLTRASTFMSQQACKILEPDIGDETKPFKNPSVQAVKGYINGIRDATTLTLHWQNLSALAETAAVVPKIVRSDLLVEVAAKNLADHNGIDPDKASILVTQLCHLGVGNAVAMAHDACEGNPTQMMVNFMHWKSEHKIALNNQSLEQLFLARAKEAYLAEWATVGKEHHRRWKQRTSDGCRLLMKLEIEMNDTLTAIGVEMTPEIRARRAEFREASCAIPLSTKALLKKTARYSTPI